MDWLDVVDAGVDGRDADGLIAELDRMRPVYEAAMAYQLQYDSVEYGSGEEDRLRHRELIESCRAQKEALDGRD